MLEVLKFIFSSFWIWLGFTILIFIIMVGLSEMFNIQVVHNYYNKDKEPENKEVK